MSAGMDSHEIREVFLDTETTGFSPSKERIVELCCIERIDGVRIGRKVFQQFNPMCPVSVGAEKIHGYSNAFLATKPVFASITPALMAFLEGAKVIAHNAPFDVSFLDMELERSNGRKMVDLTSEIVCSLALARSLFPGQKCSLDALCARFGINTTRRQQHRADIDTLLLIEVYDKLLETKRRREAL